MTVPVSWRGTIAQYAGRLHRLYDGKREVCVYHYADLNVPMLARMFDRRVDPRVAHVDARRSAQKADSIVGIVR